MNHQKRVLPAAIQGVKKQSGSLLVEAMIAILIFSFGLLGLVGLQATATQTSIHAEERIRASLLANDMVSMLWVRQSLTHASVASDVTSWETMVQTMANSGLPNATGNVTINGNIATITITWKAPSKKAGDNASQYVTSIAMKS